MKELELIALYYYFCECYDTDLRWYCQRFSPNSSPVNEKMTDEELLTIYFYCRRYENKHLKSQIWDYTNRYMRSWFPNLPAYANFNSRMNNLSSALNALVGLQLDSLKTIDYQLINEEISLVDALPVMLCSGKRQAKVATELSDKTYCATKGIYYFGIKLHFVAFQRPKNWFNSNSSNVLVILTHYSHYSTIFFNSGSIWLLGLSSAVLFKKEASDPDQNALEHGATPTINKAAVDFSLKNRAYFATKGQLFTLVVS